MHSPKVRLLLVFIGIVQAGCGVSERERFSHAQKDQRIVGGAPAETGQFSAVVMLDSGCTASVIHPQYLVTAAHCVRSGEVRRAYVDNVLSVRLRDDGSLWIDDENATEPLEIESCVLHPRSEEQGFDLAVCLLVTATELQPTNLAHEGASEGETVLLVGYGFDQADGEAGTKRYVESSVSGITTEMDGQELLIGDAQMGTCRGDSGGPAFRIASDGQTLSLLGLLSGGESGLCGFGWYTNLSLHLAWLAEVTQQEPSSGSVGGADKQRTTLTQGCGVVRRSSAPQGLSPSLLVLIGLAIVRKYRRRRSGLPQSQNLSRATSSRLRWVTSSFNYAPRAAGRLRNVNPK